MAVRRPRSYWKGFLRLSLVSIAVEIYPATSSASHLSLHQIHKPSGKRIRYDKIVPGIGPVKMDDIVKGFEVTDDTYVLLEPSELDEVKLESKRTIDLVQFVDHCEIDPRFFERPYYLVPEGDVSTEGFLVIRAALETAKKVGLGQMTMRGREYLVAVKPCGRGLLLETLRYADEVRSSEEFFDDLPEPRLDKEMVTLAGELIERKTKPFDAARFKDSYADALADLVARKRNGKKIVTSDDGEERRRSGNVVDLMEALKKSVGARGKAAAGAGKRRSSRSEKRKRSA
jgi:DNA end-binding protein Ku